MDGLPPIACSCRRVLGREDLIIRYIREAKKYSEEVREIKERRIQEIQDDLNLTAYRKVIKLIDLENEMKEEIQKRNETILNSLLSGDDDSNYDKVCCKVFMNERATLGYEGERYDSIDYYQVK